MTKYKVNGVYRYTYIEEDDVVFTGVIVEADGDEDLLRKINEIIDGAIIGEFDDGGWTDQYPLTIEEIQEPSEAQKMEQAGYTPLFDLQAVG